jgi:hypothetical protein
VLVATGRHAKAPPLAWWREKEAKGSVWPSEMKRAMIMSIRNTVLLISVVGLAGQTADTTSGTAAGRARSVDYRQSDRFPRVPARPLAKAEAPAIPGSGLSQLVTQVVILS